MESRQIEIIDRQGDSVYTEPFSAYPTADNFEVKKVLTLLEHLESVGIEKVRSVSPQLDTVSFDLVDDYDRVFPLTLKIPVDYPNTQPEIVSFPVPAPVQFVWNKHCTLCTILNACAEHLRTLEEFWTEMRDLRRKCPLVESRLAERQFLAGNVCTVFCGWFVWEEIPCADLLISITLRLFVFEPRSRPEITFHGPAETVLKLQTLAERNADLWHDDEPVADNLSKLLQIDFQKERDQQQQSMTSTPASSNSPLQCLICFSSDITQQTSQNPVDIQTWHLCPKCHFRSHFECIYRWILHGRNAKLPGVLNVGANVDGQCPHCSTRIKLKMPHF